MKLQYPQLIIINFQWACSWLWHSKRVVIENLRGGHWIRWVFMIFPNNIEGVMIFPNRVEEGVMSLLI